MNEHSIEDNYFNLADTFTTQTFMNSLYGIGETKKIKIKDLKCPHCGAPIFNIANHNCEYCNSYILFF